jgi:hypothetical protein
MIAMELPPAPVSKHDDCTPATCRLTCAQEMIDGLLQATGSVRGEEVDALLDLRWHLRHRADAEAALRLFSQVRRALEERHYLGFYRLRKWLEGHIEVRVRICRGGPERSAALVLDNYCLEAVRSRCLRAALQPGEMSMLPRVRFAFVPVPAADLAPRTGCTLPSAGCLFSD